MYKHINTLTLLLFLSFQSSNIWGQSDIASARASNVGSTVTVTGIALNGEDDINGVIIYIQDSTAGIAIYDPTLISNETIVRGKQITVTGELVDYNNLLEISNVTSYSIDSGLFALPNAQVITPNQLADSLEAELIQINNVLFNNGGSIFNGSNNYSFTSNGQSGEIRVNNGSPLVGEVIPNGEINLFAIVSQYQTTYQILPRDMNDFVFNTSIYVDEALSLESFTDNSIEVSWSTNIDGSTKLVYGTDKHSLSDTISLIDTVSNHNVIISGLQAGEAYFMKGISSDGNDTAYTGLKAFTTISHSTGQIDIYFNNSVDNTVSSNVDAVYTESMADTIVKYIDLAQNSIDVSVYNNNNLNIVNALNDAHNRGVQVRYITHLTTMNASLSHLDDSIPVLRGNDEGLMHNKFIVVDKDDSLNSWILTGSTNWTPENLFTDYNNAIFIQDQSLAKAFTIEFEEMWGSNGPLPDTSNSKFGSEKEDNTPHEFVVNGINIECYFSPSDLVTSKIDDALETADSDISFALLSFTRDELGSEILYRHNNGVEVKGIIESEFDMGTEYTYLKDNGVAVESHISIPKQIHHKYAIIDALNETSDPIVVTGSHNWSTSAEVRNDENTLIIHDYNVASTYYEEFMQRYNETITYDIDELDVNLSKVYPNPMSGFINISSEMVQSIELYDIKGQLINKWLTQAKNFMLDGRTWDNGIYILKINHKDNSLESIKIIKQ
mgnify:CR=1 FL=1